MSPLSHLDIPPSTATVSVQIIKSFESITCQSDLFFQPGPGNASREEKPLICSGKAFLIEHPSSRKRIVFDLGVRKEPNEILAPFLCDILEKFRVVFGPDTAETLQDGGVDLNSISSIIWSHSHWDHSGYPNKFPNATLIVGPGTQEAFRPGWPDSENAHTFEGDFRGRSVQEISFSTNDLVIAGMSSHDFFGDGSFYLLDAPGHCVGHMVGLARVTVSPSTFLLFGGDACHHVGMLRPSSFSPLPSSLEADLPSCLAECARDAPFLTLPGMHGAYADLEASKRTLLALQALDARDDVLLLLSHDDSVNDTIRWFPDGANEWKSDGWKERAYWAFLKVGNPSNRWRLNA